MPGEAEPQLRFRAEASGTSGVVVPNTTIVSIPSSWYQDLIRLQISTPDDSTFEFSAAPTWRLDQTIVLGRAGAGIVSGGSGKFTGKSSPCTWLLSSSWSLLDINPCRQFIRIVCYRQRRKRNHRRILEELGIQPTCPRNSPGRFCVCVTVGNRPTIRGLGVSQSRNWQRIII